MKVVYLYLLWMISVVPFLVWGQEVSVTSEINPHKQFSEFEQLQGNITILHTTNQKVDMTSFRMDGKPLQATLSSDVPLSPEGGLVMSTYAFNLPGKDGGLYILPSVTVNVGGKEYQSLASSYQVQSSANIPTQGHGPVQSFLELTLQINGDTPIYPGDFIVAVYKFIFNNSVEMTEEILPLLQPSSGFQTVGLKQVRDYVENGANVHEISQKLKAITPGIYSFPQSKITGYVYMMSTFEGRIYLKPPLTAVAAPITLTIASPST